VQSKGASILTKKLQNMIFRTMQLKSIEYWPWVPLKFKQLGYVRLHAMNEQIQPGSCSDNARKSNTMGAML
jgi:hypothetical protein